ncbi:MAG: glycosyl transferase family 36, partial [Candidatus Pacebacteria bacterium]|nr:glycosyl transferase family 36 [Candidatus Paceibacterota bacterium]
WDKVACMALTLPVAAYAGERGVFFGPYRAEHNPVAVETGALQSAAGSSGNLVSCLRHSITLAPGESLEFHILLGVADKKEGMLESACLPLLEKYGRATAVEGALDDVKQYWREYTSAVQVDTPSDAMDTYLNAWNPYQGKITFLLSRNASYYHWGLTRGMGFRDSLQDTISVVLTDPDLVRERILLLARYQRSDGVCAHCFHPVSGVAEFTGHKDDPLWLITAAWYYLAETGDASILSASASFYDGKDGTLLDHLRASVRFIDNNLGPNGIPTFGRGDWNDTLDFVGGEEGGGESVWAGMAYAYNLRLLADIARIVLKDEEWANELETTYQAAAAALNAHAWDGEWYLRAVCADGRKLGSSECDEGRIYLNPQTWSVLSGVADEQRADTVMQSAADHLDTEFGPKLLAPAYHAVDDRIGLITRCVWGKKENGAIFNHTTTWAIIAECLLGHGTRATEMYERLAPASFDSDRYQVEPYVYAQYTTSDEHETFGQGSHAWLTGTAAWMFRAALDHILGARPTLEGLRIDPCIHPDWSGYRVIRVYRGTRYDIDVRNPGHVARGVSSIRVDGEEHDPSVVLPSRPGTTVGVQVTMRH